MIGMKRAFLTTGCMILILTGANAMAASQTPDAASSNQSLRWGSSTHQTSAGQLMLVSEAGGVRIRALQHDSIETPLQEGDLITRMDGVIVELPEDILGPLRIFPELETITLTVRRGEETLSLETGTQLWRHFMTPAPPQPPEPPA